MKGIILAGGSGTRLYPATLPVCKQLLAVYDKPMIYYPLSVLMLAGIREILIISTPKDLSRFEEVFGDGASLGLKLAYAVQAEPRGLAEAFIIGEEFLGGESAALIFGDNIFFGHGLPQLLQKARRTVERHGGAHNFAALVQDPERFGILEFDRAGRVKSIEEKPLKPKSNFASLGLYFFDGEASRRAKTITPSARGELEITSLLEQYLKEDRLRATPLGRGFAWFDTGTHDSLLDASEFVMTIEKRTGFKVGCIEEVAYTMGYIKRIQLRRLAEPLMKSGYGHYLERVAGEPRLKSAR